MVPSIVITGGPCAGKTSVINSLQESFNEQILIVPEAATIILKNGFPVPDQKFPWLVEWKIKIQKAIFQLQDSQEKIYGMMAEHQHRYLLICGRGILDGAAYVPGGLDQFLQLFKVKLEDIYNRYAMVIHLESLATGAPELYSLAGNLCRFESLPEAANLEDAIQKIWMKHRWYTKICCQGSIKNKIDCVTATINKFLQSPDTFTNLLDK